MNTHAKHVQKLFNTYSMMQYRKQNDDVNFESDCSCKLNFLSIIMAKYKKHSAVTWKETDDEITICALFDDEDDDDGYYYDG